MTKDQVKEAYNSAEKELKEKQVNELKKVITVTLEKIDDLDHEIAEKKEEIKKLEEEKKILKLDIDDFKEGRLDRIEERQKKDKKAKEVSVVQVEKVIVREEIIRYEPWYHPYQITWISYPKISYPSFPTQINCGGDLGTTLANKFIGYCNSSNTSIDNASFTLTSSTAKNNVIGTYIVHDDPINLR